MSTTERALDTQELEQRVKDMYREVAEKPSNEFHFETGRQLAERLGYPSDQLDAIPPPSIDSFAGVGYYFDLAAITAGETVVDLGSGSGTDSFLAANQTGAEGRVIGIDMTEAQLAKATASRASTVSGTSSSATRTSSSSGSRAAPPTSSSRTASSTSPPTRQRSSPKQRASSARAAGSRSPTSSPPPSSPKASPATPRSGPPASAAPCNATTTAKRSKPPASSSTT